ncbi:hypothetical protein EWM64_g6349 [Hericium alpestre]|uniref:Uncharacterized protein n=1 Tax=Hericium alpestre TaxID=135208 RepID=A0A4Y9ZUF8_9AGAM|nr:hypothetical protein EWM64_g6349 [Hericium alpestre]
MPPLPTPVGDTANVMQILGWCGGALLTAYKAATITPRAFERLQAVEKNLNKAEKLLKELDPDQRTMVLALNCDSTKYRPLSELETLLKETECLALEREFRKAGFLDQYIAWGRLGEKLSMLLDESEDLRRDTKQTTGLKYATGQKQYTSHAQRIVPNRSESPGSSVELDSLPGLEHGIDSSDMV